MASSVHSDDVVFHKDGSVSIPRSILPWTVMVDKDEAGKPFLRSLTIGQAAAKEVEMWQEH